MIPRYLYIEFGECNRLPLWLDGVMSATTKKTMTFYPLADKRHKSSTVTAILI